MTIEANERREQFLNLEIAEPSRILKSLQFSWKMQKRGWIKIHHSGENIC